MPRKTSARSKGLDGAITATRAPGTSGGGTSGGSIPAMRGVYVLELGRRNEHAHDARPIDGRGHATGPAVRATARRGRAASRGRARNAAARAGLRDALARAVRA